MVSAPLLRVVFLGTPEFAVPTLDALLRSRHEVVGVVTQPDRPRGRGHKTSYAPVKARALDAAVPLRLFVVDASVGRDPGGLMVFINPEFVERDGTQLEEEGCLSVPGFNATVVRPMRAVLRGFDREWEMRTVEATGILARAFQHEMDHLDGTLFVDRLRGIKRDLIVRKIRKLTRAGKW